MDRAYLNAMKEDFKKRDALEVIGEWRDYSYEFCDDWDNCNEKIRFDAPYLEPMSRLTRYCGESHKKNCAIRRCMAGLRT